MSNIKREIFDDALLAAETHRLLASPYFTKAHRAQTLLRYLIEHAQVGRADAFNEYAIGLTVFGRKAAAYSTGEDPIVRVHVGRLRRRLQEYYAAEGRDSPLRITIPLGEYRPRIERCLATADARLAFEPLACLTAHTGAYTFTHSLNEELRYRLRDDFGASPLDQTTLETVSHLLQGNVWLEGGSLRTSLRLLSMANRRLVWSEQINHSYEASTEYRQRITRTCSEALRRHLVRV